MKTTLLDAIVPGLRQPHIDPARVAEAQARLDALTKPQGSLGRLEELARRLYALRPEHPLTVMPAVMLTVAGDHGVAERGVSPFPQAVTRQMVHNFLCGGAAVNALCKAGGMDLYVVDAGCAGGPFAPHPLLLDRRLGDGTADMSQGPAMSRETCLEGLRRGVALARELAARGYRCLGLGEMGIANSTAGAALGCALLDLPPKDMAGPGAGADPTMVRHKAAVLHEALTANAAALRYGDAVDALAALGGFELTLMAGLLLGAAGERLPVLVDGFICTAACVAALRICPEAAPAVFLSHVSAEPGHTRMTAGLADLLPAPLLHLDMRLGEGTGGAVAYHLLRCAAAVFNDMATFDEAGVAEKLL